AAGIADLIAGQVQLMMEGLNSITPHAKTGRVRALGVSGPKRSPALPDVPTIAEGGVAGYEATTWNGIVVPAGTPRAIVNLLNQKINASLASNFVREKFAAIGAEPGNKTPEEYAAFIRAEYKKWGDVVKRSGAKIE
ncbi:MAG TPA: tripartite tricarboxylate transporter substrate-binding protein, partial [Afifellaceae bacterium]|nr:tripartite tricarboxylate transporter substrate-binding protein [Afifellaceae bacterium]